MTTLIELRIKLKTLEELENKREVIAKKMAWYDQDSPDYPKWKEKKALLDFQINTLAYTKI